MSHLPSEYTTVEKPFLTQLAKLGWEVLELKNADSDVPYLADPERTSLREVLLKSRLKRALKAINTDSAGESWLTDEHVTQMINRLDRLQGQKLMEANEEATNLLLLGFTVQLQGEARGRTARYMDFDNPARNDFIAISQFKVENPAISVGEKAIKPDITLFVNGIPLVVIEAKSPSIEEPIYNAIKQLLRYSNQRSSSDIEGVEKLFHYNQLLVATSFDFAHLGTVGAKYKHFQEWKDPYPLSPEALNAKLGKEASSQEILVESVLSKTALLDIIYHFILFDDANGKRVKLAPRYQQYRAVHKALKRLQHGQTKAEHGEWDERGGIIWHTQGSGKSITMMYLIRKLRTTPALRSFKVVMITDRRDLQKQLSVTADLSGESLVVARNIHDLVRELRKDGAGLVFGMIQKFQNSQEETTAAAQVPKDLNTSEKILVMIDEAHRSHASDLHANLVAALPNAVKIGFTGTPILRGKKKRTEEIFGSYIDTYTIKESQRDGSTLPIHYEGKTAQGVVAKGETLNKLFDNLFKEHTPEERELLKQKYGTKQTIFEAPKLIAEKAKDMLRHYVANILPDQFKGQVVASSRLAAVRYFDALEIAKRELIKEIEDLDDAFLEMDAEELQETDADMAFLVRAHRELERLKRLEFAVVISAEHNQEDFFDPWTDKTKQDAFIERFKKPFKKDKHDNDGDDLGFLIVKSMLLTGFDAPLEQVMYLDRSIREHELLQAIARVNRTSEGKSYGLVVDYYGVAHHLTEVLSVYSDADIEGALTSIRDELPTLRDRHLKVTKIFTDRGVSLDDTENAALLLGDIPLRAEFQVALKEFMTSLDMVLPRPEGLPYVRDAKRLGFIHLRAANLYRDNNLSLADAEEKVRSLIDRYIEATGTKVMIEEVEILSSSFNDKVAQYHHPRSKAAEMEHAARHHIRIHAHEDPAYYQKLSERLEQILAATKDDWEEQVKAFEAFLERIREGRPADKTGLNPKTHAPFFSLLAARQTTELSDEALVRYIDITSKMVDKIRKDISLVDFWRRAALQQTLRSQLKELLDDENAVPYGKIDAVADDILQLSKALHMRLTE
jgi:type I restriction enzyme, R subunit